MSENTDDEETTDFQLTPLRVEHTADTPGDAVDGVIGRGAELPSGKIVIEWDRTAIDQHGQLEHPHQSVYGSRADVEAGTGGRVVAEPTDTTDAPADDTTDDSGDSSPDSGDSTDDSSSGDDTTDDSGSEPAPEPDDGYVLEIASTIDTPAMTYQFTTPGAVEEHASLEQHDEIETADGETKVTGLVGPRGSDSYQLEQRPTSWQAVDNDHRVVAEHRYELTLDGEPVTVDELLEGGRKTHRVEIATPHSVEYSFQASGPITKVVDPESEWSAEDKNDEITELDDGTWSATGYTGNNYGDSFDYEGELLNFTPVDDGPLSVYVDGVQVRTASINGDSSELEVVEPQVGGGEGYAHTVPQSDADVEVSDLSSLGHALADASSGDVVYVSPTAEIDMGSSEVTVPSGVTLASNRGVDGAPGALLKTDRETEQIHVEANARVTGLRIQGKYYEYFDPRDEERYPVGNGVQAEGDGAEIDNCEIWGHAHAAVDCNQYSAHVHHNYIHHTLRAGLGYGVIVWGGHPVIEWNYFNNNRHAVAGSGGGVCGFTARFNHVGPDTIGHIFDMHRPGGDRIDIYRNTVEGYIKFTNNGRTPAVTIRGVPSKKARIRDNWFYNDRKPRDTPSGWTAEAITQVFVDAWENVEWDGNHYGEDPPSDPDVGCPVLWNE